MSARSIRRRSERESRRRAARAATAAIGAALVLAPSAGADILTVDVAGDGPVSTCDPGSCTLRDALYQAIFTTGGDDIVFAPAVTSITVSSGDIEISSAVSIIGPGEGALTIDANDASRIFDIDTAPDQPVSISGLTMVDGKSPGGPMGPYEYGGAIVSSDADLTLADVTISSSYATKAGPALAAFGDVSLTGVTITDNVSHYEAGGVHVFGDLTITDSTISDLSLIHI